MAVSKRTRFEVFKRDGFRCVYCGATPIGSVLTVKLHADHVHAKSKGGEDDSANLVTACEVCNLGKAAVPLDEKRFKSSFGSEAEREHAEQLREYLKVQRDISDAKKEAEALVLEHWEDRMGEWHWQLPRFIPGAIKEFGLEAVMECVDVVARKDLRSQVDAVRYFCGVLRNWRQPKESAVDKSLKKANKEQGKTSEMVEAEWNIALGVLVSYCQFRWGYDAEDLRPFIRECLSGKNKISFSQIYLAVDMTVWADDDEGREYSGAYYADRFRRLLSPDAEGKRRAPWTYVAHLTSRGLKKRVDSEMAEELCRHWHDLSGDEELVDESVLEVIEQAISDTGTPFLSGMVERFLRERSDLPAELNAEFFRRAIVWHANDDWLRALSDESPIRKWPEYSEMVKAEA